MMRGENITESLGAILYGSMKDRNLKGKFKLNFDFGERIKVHHEHKRAANVYAVCYTIYNRCG